MRLITVLLTTLMALTLTVGCGEMNKKPIPNPNAPEPKESVPDDEGPAAK
jgi:hypothetical protein